MKHEEINILPAEFMTGDSRLFRRVNQPQIDDFYARPLELFCDTRTYPFNRSSSPANYAQ